MGTAPSPLRTQNSSQSQKSNSSVGSGEKNPSSINGSDLNLNGIKVLLVEDSTDNRILVSRILKGAGAEVESAQNGQEGFEKALRDDYDVVVMDLQMPILDGYEATYRLRQKGYNTPIIALTAHAMHEDRKRCLNLGFNEHLTKPVNRFKLIETISSHCRNPQH